MLKLEILGTGCPKCQKLAEHTEAAARMLGLDYELVKVTDISQIVAHGVMMTPALVVNGTVKCAGSVPSVDEIRRMLD